MFQTIALISRGCQVQISRPPPVFSFAHNRVDPFRGFIRPALRANRVETPNDLEPRFILETYAANLWKVGPMKPLQGSTRLGNDETHPSSKGSDAEGRVGEALERHPLSDLVKESQTLSQRCCLRQAKVPHNIQSWPHSKVSRTRPFASRTFQKTFLKKPGEGKRFEVEDFYLKHCIEGVYTLLRKN